MSDEVGHSPYFQTMSSEHWQTGFDQPILEKTVRAQEQGQLIYFPHLAFHLFPAEMPLLTTRFSTQKRKNISYNRMTEDLRGTKKTTPLEAEALEGLLKRYAEHARLLVDNLLPHYEPALIWGRSSFRPVQITNRPTSYRKDDKRLHVDAFPSSPNQGKRILRVFCNINPQGEDRVWRVGEPFETVANQFLPGVKKPMKGSGKLMKILGLTKGMRTLYDHYMLQIHDAMKGNLAYQKTARQAELRFPPGSTWIVFSDQVSHAAMSGQYLLEQTFYLPVEGMHDPRLSPLRILERKLGQPLI